MINKNNFTIISFLFLASCLSIKPKLSSYAYTKPYKSDSLEIELPFISSSYPMHHVGFKKYYSHESNWIYISKWQKTISSNHLILIENKNLKRPVKSLIGEIKILDSTLIINLKQAYYKKNTLKRWVNYKLNGAYIMR